VVRARALDSPIPEYNHETQVLRMLEQTPALPLPRAFVTELEEAEDE
jgi:hypothetical protein